MKTTRIQRVIRGTLAAVLVGLITFTCMPAKAAHELIYAVDLSDNLVSFYSDTPGTFVNPGVNITGLVGGGSEEIRGIDYWNGTIYGLGSSSRLYTIDPNTGAATLVGPQFTPLLSGQTFGVDNGPSGFRIAGGAGQNLLVSRATGAVISVDPVLHYAVGGLPRVDALAYDDASGIWYAADTLLNNLTTLDPTTGLVTTIGPLGFDMARFNGMDISPFTGIMYAISGQSSSDPQGNLYTIDKTSGLYSLVGQVGNPGDNILYRALTVVPEPSSIALLALGASGLLFARRRHE